MRQVTGEIRQNKPAIRVLPVDGQSDPESANIYSAIIRHIDICLCTGNKTSNILSAWAYNLTDLFLRRC